MCSMVYVCYALCDLFTVCMTMWAKCNNLDHNKRSTEVEKRFELSLKLISNLTGSSFHMAYQNTKVHKQDKTKATEQAA